MKKNKIRLDPLQIKTILFSFFNKCKKHKQHLKTDTQPKRNVLHKTE
jgi:hypothetical protein